jgi:hypothetical protein
MTGNLVKHSDNFTLPHFPTQATRSQRLTIPYLITLYIFSEQHKYEESHVIFSILLLLPLSSVILLSNVIKLCSSLRMNDKTKFHTFLSR